MDSKRESTSTMEPGTINLGEEDLEENGSRNKITSIVAF